jgi:hypothetical protein
MSRNRVIAATATACALALFAVLASRVFELRQVTIERSEGRAAALDPWLALDRVLSGKLEVRRYSSLDEIDFSGAGLVVAEGEKASAYDEASKAEGKSGGLGSWVAGGGRLVIAWSGYYYESEVSLPSFPELAPKASEAEREVTSGRARGSYLGKAVDIEAAGSIRFDRPEAGEGYLGLSDDTAIRLVLRSSGKGWALAGARPLFLENRRLADPGNRDFAGELLGQGMEGVVWLPAPSRGETAAKAGGLAARKAFLPVAGTALLVCLALLWLRAPRFGPTIPEPSADRRSILERFRAEGRFLLDRGAGEELLRRIGAAPPPGKATRARIGEAIRRAIELKVLEARDRKEGRR